MKRLKFPQSLHTRRTAFQPLSNGGTSLQRIFLSDLHQRWLGTCSCKAPVKQPAPKSYGTGTAHLRNPKRHLQAGDDNSSFMGQLDLGVSRWLWPQPLICFLRREGLGSLTWSHTDTALLHCTALAQGLLPVPASQKPQADFPRRMPPRTTLT